MKERAWILAEIETPDAAMAEVARHAHICTSLVYKWGREGRKTARLRIPAHGSSRSRATAESASELSESACSSRFVKRTTQGVRLAAFP
jgi:transposase-like protein